MRETRRQRQKRVEEAFDYYARPGWAQALGDLEPENANEERPAPVLDASDAEDDALDRAREDAEADEMCRDADERQAAFEEHCDNERKHRTEEGF